MAVKVHKRPNRTLSRSVEILAQVPDNVKYLELDANGCMKVLFKDKSGRVQPGPIGPVTVPEPGLVPSFPVLSPVELQAEYVNDKGGPLNDVDLVLCPPKGMEMPYLEPVQVTE